MFDGLPTAPADAIFGLMADYRDDPHPEKINLGAGIYHDEEGRTPVLAAVKAAERRIWERETSKSYLAIEGDARLARQVPSLLFGERDPLAEEGRLVSVHTPGGTGALRVIAELLHAHRPETTVWMPEPTWINHPKIFAAAGLRARTYPYLDDDRRTIDFGAMQDTLQGLDADDVVVLHGCCHNPSGVDPSIDQWMRLGRLLHDRGAVPLVDIAYQGFGQGLEEDTLGLRALCRQISELIVCVSFSKNFAIYNERVGALTVLTRSAASADAARSQVKSLVRASYSNPPAHGAAIVATILGDPELGDTWQHELAGMRERIVEMRRLFVACLDERGVALGSNGNDFLLEQLGMFSFSGLGPTQIKRLREEHFIYIVDSGRVNFAGMTPGNMGRLCDAIAQVRGR